jgi:hypothetical protein
VRPVGNLLVLGFGDLAKPSAPAPRTLAALAPPGACCVMTDPQWRTTAAAQLEALAALAQDHPSLICIGLGAGGYGALAFGRLLGAAAIYVAAPGADADSPVDAADLDDLEALFADPDLATPGQELRLVTADDSLARDLAFAARLQGASAKVAVDHAALPSGALPLALAQSGLWVSQITAGLAGEPVPEAGDVAACWREAFAHALEIDLADIYRDTGGALHLPGRLLNRSPGVLDLAMASAERVRIGARVRSRGDGRKVLAEGRSRFAVGILNAGQSSPFRLALPSLPADASALEVALVCEGRFWLDTVGFPSVMFSLDGTRAEGSARGGAPARTSLMGAV